MALIRLAPVPIANEPTRRAQCDSIKDVLSLGVVQSSRFSPRRADPSNKCPARRIAGGEALFQAFVDLVFGRRGSHQLRLALAPRNRGAMPTLCNGPGHHVTGESLAQPRMRQEHAADAPSSCS